MKKETLSETGCELLQQLQQELKLPWPFCSGHVTLDDLSVVA